jgi:hypothetical protein
MEALPDTFSAGFVEVRSTGRVIEGRATSQFRIKG